MINVFKGCCCLIMGVGAELLTFDVTPVLSLDPGLEVRL